MNDMQQQPMNYLERLRSGVNPQSAMGTVGNQDLYTMHMQQALQAGGQPLSRQMFLQALQAKPELADIIRQGGMRGME
jgi:hypothetical protein